MALQQLAGSNAQNNPNFPGNFIPSIQPLPPQLGLLGNPLGGGLASVNLLEYSGPGDGPIIDNNFFGGPYKPPGFGNFIDIQPPTLGIAQPDYSSQFENFGKTLGGFGETLGGYSGQFEKFGEQLGGLGEQMTGYQDALGSFNEQVGGMGKQFETISNRLDSVDKGLGSLGNQIANIENMQKAQPQEVQPQPQPQRPAFNPFNPFGFGGLGSLFGRRY